MSTIAFIGLADVVIRVMGFMVTLVAYSRTKRKSVLLFGVFILLHGVLGTYGFLLDYPLLMIWGVGIAAQVGVLSGVFLLREELAPIEYVLRKYRTPLVVLLAPLWFALFSTAVFYITKNMSSMLFCVYVPTGVIFIILGGVIIESFSVRYGRGARFLGVIVIAMGFFKLFQPFIMELVGANLEIAAIFSITSSIFTILLSVAFFVLANTRTFKVYRGSLGAVEPKEGAFFAKDIENIVKVFGGYPVLAFLRTPIKNEKWNVYTLTPVKVENSIFPTDLYKLVDFVARYSQEASSVGVKPVVILESPEFLRVYNDFSSLAKTLSGIFDYLTQNKGSLILITDPDAWDEKEFNILKRVLSLKKFEG